MGFFLGLLSSGQKFHFRSADSCYLRKLACLSRNLLNEQEIKYIYMDQYKTGQRDDQGCFYRCFDSNP